jgi:hypothetical protein
MVDNSKWGAGHALGQCLARLTSDGTGRISAAARTSATESLCASVSGAVGSPRRSHSDSFSRTSLSVMSNRDGSVDAIAYFVLGHYQQRQQRMVTSCSGKGGGACLKRRVVSSELATFLLWLWMEDLTNQQDTGGLEKRSNMRKNMSVKVVIFSFFPIYCFSPKNTNYNIIITI